VSTFGPDYDARLDRKRVRTQMLRVRDHMLVAAIRGRWLTLERISKGLERLWTGSRFPEASVSAQLRHLKKPQFGGYRVEKRRRGRSGTWEYRLLPPLPPQGVQMEWTSPEALERR